MTSAKQLFNLTIAKKAFKRTMPVWLIHAIVWAFALPVILGNFIAEGYTSVNDIGEYVLQASLVLGISLGCAASALMNELLTNYLYSTRSISLYHSIPVRRECLFVTHGITALAALIIPMAGCSAIAAAMAPDAVGYILQGVGIYSLMILFFTGFSMLCCHMTGHVAVGTVVYVILNFTAIVMEYVVKYITSFFYFGYEASDFVTMKLSPIVYLIGYTSVDRVRDASGNVIGYEYDGMGYLMAIAAVGLVLMGLAWLLYRCRKSEAAGEVISHMPLRPVFKYSVTTGFAFIIGLLFYAVSYMARSQGGHSVIWMGVCMVMGGAIGYWGAEMLLRKSLRVIRTGWKGFAAVVICIALFCTAMSFDVFGVESHVPELEDVKYAYMNGAYYDYSFEADKGDAVIADMLELHQTIVDNRDALEEISVSGNVNWREYENYRFSNISFNFTLDNGQQVIRQYYIPVRIEDGKEVGISDVINSIGSLIDRIGSAESIIRKAYPGIWGDQGLSLYDVTVCDYNDGRYSYRINYAEYNGLVEAVKKDLTAGTMLTNDEFYIKYDKYAYVETTEAAEAFSIELNFEARFENGETRHDWEYFNISPEWENTYEFLMDKSIYVPGGNEGDPVYPSFIDEAGR